MGEGLGVVVAVAKRRAVDGSLRRRHGGRGGRLGVSVVVAIEAAGQRRGEQEESEKAHYHAAHGRPDEAPPFEVFGGGLVDALAARYTRGQWARSKSMPTMSKVTAVSRMA